MYWPAIGRWMNAELPDIILLSRHFKTRLGRRKHLFSSPSPSASLPARGISFVLAFISCHGGDRFRFTCSQSWRRGGNN